MKVIPFWLLGVGGVGSTLLGLLQDAGVQRAIAARAGVEFRPVLLADRSGYLADPAGLAPALVAAALEHKAARGALRELPAGHASRSMAETWAGLRDLFDPAGTVGVDATATDDTGPVLVEALATGAGIVLANKRPLTAGWSQWQALAGTRRLRHEATVGAGLPVISTLAALLDAGDRVTSIQGCFSGTLGYLTSALNAGQPYSAAVRSAMEEGYSEPDPRDDLSGLDVARKALILARMLGRRLELDALHVAPMIPDRLAGLTLPEFLRRMPEADAEMRAAVEAAASHGQRLSYVADLSGEIPRVGLQKVDGSSPVGRLSGTDNIILIHTERYHQSPLVVQGPGAGRAVTAAGVLSDMIALAREEL